MLQPNPSILSPIQTLAQQPAAGASWSDFDVWVTGGVLLAIIVGLSTGKFGADLVLLFGLVGWQVALTYLGFGLGIAVVAGFVIGKLRLEGWLQDWVREIHFGADAPAPIEAERLTMVDRYRLGITALREIFAKVWIWIILGIAIGALIHGYVPKELLGKIMGSDAWWSVPAAVLLGIPMYTNAAGVIPIVEALLGKGAALGTVLAFMMSAIALSLPEMIILRQVLTLRLIAVFIGVVASGILAVGFLFNLIF